VLRSSQQERAEGDRERGSGEKYSKGNANWKLSWGASLLFLIYRTHLRSVAAALVVGVEHQRRALQHPVARVLVSVQIRLEHKPLPHRVAPC
jgi:hypothetical protein